LPSYEREREASLAGEREKIRRKRTNSTLHRPAKVKKKLGTRGTKTRETTRKSGEEVRWGSSWWRSASWKRVRKKGNLLHSEPKRGGGLRAKKPSLGRVQQKGPRNGGGMKRSGQRAYKRKGRDFSPSTIMGVTRKVVTKARFKFT